MKLPYPVAVLAAALLSACGGGGGGASTPNTATTAAPAAPRSTALADNPAPAAFDFAATRSAAGIRSSDLVPDAHRFGDPARTYVSIWAPGPGPDQERLQLALMSLQLLQALDAHGGLVLQLPTAVHRLGFDVYDERGAASALRGEITR